ncbi:hypothetical protein [Streptomyces viridochromogenes]|uniref:hypothetical protein n=1 Tax=Streptomyces viridochromogenes TaxID=1938 RepID=UPI0013315D35|nr:hypothetical protein [Streptomyces viridochromogenes]
MSAQIEGKRAITRAWSRGSVVERGGAAMGAKVLERFPAGSPRGSWPAEEYAAARRAEGKPATVVMDLKSDAFLVVIRARNED